MDLHVPVAATSADHVAVADAVRQLADQLGIRQAEAASLLIVSGIPTLRVDERVRLAREDVTAYATHLAQQAANRPSVRGGPDIGYEAEPGYRAEQDSQ
ncbi:hypothetical protein [Nonomuraea sp. NPDC049646]